MNAHPALFEREGEERGEPKNEALLFQSTVDIHLQNAHKTQKLRRLAFCAFIRFCASIILLYYNK